MGRAGAAAQQVIDGVAGGLIAGGALLLVPSLLEPAQMEWITEVERIRRLRNADIAKWLSAVLTLAGAALLLAHSEVLWALPAVGLTLISWYLSLALGTRRTYLQKARFYRCQIESGNFIAINESPYVGRGNWNPTDEALMGGVMAKATLPDEEAAHTLAIAEERSTWRWVLRHPAGARNAGL